MQSLDSFTDNKINVTAHACFFRPNLYQHFVVFFILVFSVTDTCAFQLRGGTRDQKFYLYRFNIQ